MITRNLSRRLERLEDRMMPEVVRRVWQIVIDDYDGTRRKGETIEWEAPRPISSLSKKLPIM